ncbi:MAG: hypothetical protein BZY88_16225 [SAR202 cluster bacterium Io17-Chloro-G9]|nr:MAG: hypothetical protein BZY88_16225 [SAR202 cluster bacterium Io17-Chloro-G9]
MGVGSALWSVARFMVGAHPIQKRGAARSKGAIYGGETVRVRRQWNDHRIGKVRWSDISNPRWDILSGGTQTKAPQPFVHAYVYCDKVQGDIAHSCNHGPGPHNIKVCLVKKDNSKEVWNYLMKIVGKKPPRRFFADR